MLANPQRELSKKCKLPSAFAKRHHKSLRQFANPREGVPNKCRQSSISAMPHHKSFRLLANPEESFSKACKQSNTFAMLHHKSLRLSANSQLQCHTFATFCNLGATGPRPQSNLRRWHAQSMLCQSNCGASVTTKKTCYDLKVARILCWTASVTT